MSQDPDDTRRVSDYLKEQQGEQPDDGGQQHGGSGQRAQQPGGRPSQGQAPQAGGQSPQRGGPPERAGGGSGDDGLTRRQLLAGGAGAAVVAAGAGWWVFLRGGPSGAEAVATDYVNAIADNDWEAAGALFHEDSAVGLSDQPYETNLEQRGQLETYEATSPSVEDQYTTIHITDVDAAAEADDLSLPGEIDPADIDELKQVRVLASVQTANLEVFENQTDYLGDTVTADFNVSLVQEAGNWYISETFGTPALI